VRQQIRTPAGRRFDQAGGEIERGEGGLEIFDEIGAERLAAAGVLAFGPITDPAAEFGEKRAGIEMLTYPRNRVGSIRHIFFSLFADFVERNLSGYAARWKWHGKPNKPCQKQRGCNKFRQQPGV